MTEQEAIDYLKNVVIDTKIGIENIIKTSNLINVCIEALEKQILKKPIFVHPLQENMTKELIIECMTCKEECEEENSCFECAKNQLAEYENQIRKNTIDECIKALKCYGKCDLADKITLLEQLKEKNNE